MKDVARRSALAYKAKDKNIVVLDAFSMDAPSTKMYAQFLANLNVADNRTLFVTAEANNNAYLSARNIENAEVATCETLNTYSILKAKNLILTEDAVNKLTENFKAN